MPNNMIFRAQNISELLQQQKNLTNLQIIGGSTYIKTLPEKALSIRNIKELSQIDKHERYVSIGPAVTLNSILFNCKNYLPKVLYKAILGMANHNIRNIATLGGNICARDTRLSLYAPLLALDTALKFKSLKKEEQIPLKQFTKIPSESILTEIRIPINDWDVSIYRRLGPNNALTNDSGSFCFLAQTEKDILMNLKLVFACPFVYTNRELETRLMGSKLPLSSSSIAYIMNLAEETFEQQTKDIECSPILRQQFINLMAFSLHELT